MSDIGLICQNDTSLSEKDFRRVCEVIFEHCGITLHDGKKALVRSRLSKRLRQTDFGTFTEYIDYALSPEGQEEFYNLVDSISTNLTSFFREKPHFEYLRRQFMPDLIARKEKLGHRKVRFWSAGCSSGEEPYSLAITLLEEFQGMSKWDIKILATDVSTRILEKAKKGSYEKDRVAPLNAMQKQRFLGAGTDGKQRSYNVSKELKNIITFRYLNLMDNWPFNGPFDCIFCRNVMIYFDKETQGKLVNRYWDCLNKGGLLCIGHSESLTSIKHHYKYVQPATYMKT